MAYGTIYECITYDRLNNSMEIQIQQLDYSGAISKMILDGDPLEIIHNRNDRVYGTGAIVNILNDFSDKYLFAKMFATSYGTYKLKIGLAGSTIFEGFLLPQTFNQDVRYKSYVALVFGNGLKMLENTTPSFLTTGATDYVTEMAVLINIFSYLDLDYTIYINSTLYEDNMSVGEKADNPLRYTFINRLVFRGNDGEWNNALMILNKILKSINADCYIRNERIMIERFVDRDTNPKTLWTYDPVGVAYSSTSEAFNEKTLDFILLSAKSLRYQVDPAIKKLKVKLNQSGFHNIFNNFFDRMTEHATLYYFQSWARNEYVSVSNDYFSNSFITRGITITKRGGDSWGDFEAANLRYEGIFSNPSDEVEFSFRFKCWQNIISGKAFDFTYRISLVRIPAGTIYWINTSGIVEFSTANNLLTFTVENDSGESKADFSIEKTFDLAGQLDALGLTDECYFRLQIYAPLYYTIGSGVKVANACTYGDFALSQSNIRIDNLLEADLDNDAFKVVSEELCLYDAGYINYLACKVLEDTFGYVATSAWTDDINTSETLQRHYVLNQGNLYNSSCSILHMTIIDEDESINIDDIFVFNNLEDDLGNPMKFYIDNMSFNVKKHIYKLTLKQWLADVGKGIA